MLQRGLSLLEQCHGRNTRHAAITGARGVGKTSLALAIEALAKKDTDYLALAGLTETEPSYEFAIVNHIAQPGEDAAALSAAIARALAKANGKRRGAAIRDVAIDAKVIKFRLEGTNDPAPDLPTRFVEVIEELTDSSGKRSYLVVIDELDRMAGVAGVASLFKAVTEMLVTAQREEVMFVLVGLEGVMETLAQDHASAPRIFDELNVPLLTEDQSVEFLKRALFGSGVTIDDEAARLAAKAGAGLPYRLHAVGWATFNQADDRITVDMVQSALASLKLGQSTDGSG